MQPIQFECPHCQAINAGDESLYGRRVKCVKCGATILVPPAPVSPDPLTARLIPGTGGPAVPVRNAADLETEVFSLTPAVQAFSGQILLGLVCLCVGVALATRIHDFAWAPVGALAVSALGAILLLFVWVRVKSCNYRLTTQRLFVRRGWLAKHVDEMELYRVKDIVVDQGALQRVFGYGTITVLADDDTTPQLHLVRISSPAKIKELIRTQYRAARQREGVRPTEFMRSP